LAWLMWQCGPVRRGGLEVTSRVQLVWRGRPPEAVQQDQPHAGECGCGECFGGGAGRTGRPDRRGYGVTATLRLMHKADKDIQKLPSRGTRNAAESPNSSLS
jgi:hypothetical protein